MRIAKAFAAVVALVLTSTSCGDVVRQSRSSVLLVIDRLDASRGGANAGQFGSPLLSDVITNVTAPAPCTPASPCPTVFNDVGQVTLRLVPKDITIAPTSNNQVTITRYRVTFKRSDGRNTQGVDVPYAFDSAVTGTVPSTGTITFTFELVRHTAKYESPLVQLITNPNVISTVAEVVFYGHDQVGNDISVTGLIQVDFGNFGDF
jgi:hypothetical protein